MCYPKQSLNNRVQTAFALASRYKLYPTDTQKRNKKKVRCKRLMFKVILKKFKPAVSELWVGRAVGAHTHAGNVQGVGDQDGAGAPSAQ